jgi:hypothetical protein
MIRFVVCLTFHEPNERMIIIEAHPSTLRQAPFGELRTSRTWFRTMQAQSASLDKLDNHLTTVILRQAQDDCQKPSIPSDMLSFRYRDYLRTMQSQHAHPDPYIEEV